MDDILVWNSYHNQAAQTDYTSPPTQSFLSRRFMCESSSDEALSGVHVLCAGHKDYSGVFQNRGASFRDFTTLVFCQSHMTVDQKRNPCSSKETHCQKLMFCLFCIKESWDSHESKRYPSYLFKMLLTLFLLMLDVICYWNVPFLLLHFILLLLLLWYCTCDSWFWFVLL